MERVLLKRNKIGKFINSLSKSYEVIAPVKKRGIHVFDSINGFEDICLDYQNTIYPPKKYFLPDEEEIFGFDDNKIRTSFNKKDRIIFGLRLCDVNAFLALDHLLLDDLQDDHYLQRRKRTLIIALRCNNPGENCFCDSMDLLDAGYDLLLTESGKDFIIDIGSKKGKALLNRDFIAKSIKSKKSKDSPISKCKKKLDSKQIKKLKNSFHKGIWEETALRCLSCGACTITCPTCSCFSLRDYPDMDSSSGSRVRTWDSCQVKDFTSVAGGFVFRDLRDRRVKHRIYHKLDYFKDQFGVYMCTGCGRCITNCPTGIDMVEIVNKL